MLFPHSLSGYRFRRASISYFKGLLLVLMGAYMEPLGAQNGLYYLRCRLAGGQKWTLQRVTKWILCD
jgi:hypothetical protein